MSNYKRELESRLMAVDDFPDNLVAILISAYESSDTDRNFSVRLDNLSQLCIDAEIDADIFPPNDVRAFIKSLYPQVIHADDTVTVRMLAEIFIEFRHKEEEADPKFKNNVNRWCSKKIKKRHKKNYSVEETRAFSQWINKQLAGDERVADLIDIDVDNPEEFFAKLNNGIILCLMVKKINEDLVDDRCINNKPKHEFHKNENLNLAINTAKAIGCNITGQDPSFILEGRPNMCLGLVWQIIKAGLFANVNLAGNPYLMRLAEEGETYEDMMKLSAEDLLLRWVNFHLNNNVNYAGPAVKNFSRDIMDSCAYQYLMEEIQPKNTGIQACPAQDSDLINRAERTLGFADKLHCREFVSPRDIVQGNANLNLAFVANLYNQHPHLEPVEDMEDVIVETREESIYRNWMNSLGLKPKINYLYSDLVSGMAILKLEDIIKPGIVLWKRVNMPPFKKNRAQIKMVENCNYAIQLAPPLNIRLVGTGGLDLVQGNKTLTLGFVWQLMRAYTVSLLTRLSDDAHAKVTDRDVVAWYNNHAGSTCRNFKDPSVSDSVGIMRCLKVINPNLDISKFSGGEDLSDQQKIANARYAINIARKMGACVYTLPEDIAESNPKMILCMVVTLMVLEKEKGQQEQQ